MTTAHDRGAAHERRIAKRLGGERIPSPGRERGYAPDVAHPRFAIEAKAWAKLPLWFSDAFDQAIKSVRGAQIPVVIIHPKGGRSDNDYVLLRMKDFEELTHGGELARASDEVGRIESQPGEHRGAVGDAEDTRRD